MTIDEILVSMIKASALSLVIALSLIGVLSIYSDFKFCLDVRRTNLNECAILDTGQVEDLRDMPQPAVSRRG